MRRLLWLSGGAAFLLGFITVASIVAYAQILDPLFSSAQRGRWLPLSGVLLIELLLVVSLFFRVRWWNQARRRQHVDDAVWHIDQLKHAALSAQAITWVGALLLAYEPDWRIASSLVVLCSLGVYDILCTALVYVHDRTAKNLFMLAERAATANGAGFRMRGSLPPNDISEMAAMPTPQSSGRTIRGGGGGGTGAYSARFAVLQDTPRGRGGGGGEVSTDTEALQKSDTDVDHATMMW